MGDIYYSRLRHRYIYFIKLRVLARFCWVFPILNIFSLTILLPYDIQETFFLIWWQKENINDYQDIDGSNNNGFYSSGQPVLRYKSHNLSDPKQQFFFLQIPFKQATSGYISSSPIKTHQFCDFALSSKALSCTTHEDRKPKEL